MSRDKSSVSDALGSAESLVSAGARDSFQSQPHRGIRQGKPLNYHIGVSSGMDDDRSNQTKGASRNIAVACYSSHERDQWVKHCVKVAQVHTDQWVEHCLAVAQNVETTGHMNEGRLIQATMK